MSRCREKMQREDVERRCREKMQREDALGESVLNKV